MRASLFVTALALGASLLGSLPGQAASFGQPFLVAEDGTSGFILDFFQAGQPSGVNEIDVQGTISDAFGAPGLVGQTLEFSSSAFSDVATLSINGVPIDVFDFTPGGSFPFNPIQFGTPGVITFDLFALPPVDEFFLDTPGPGETTYTFNAPYDVFGPVVGEPAQTLQLNVFFDGELPVQVFQIFDDMGNVVDQLGYFDGPLDVTKITLGTEGGESVPAPIPEPATGLLLLVGSVGLATTRRRHR